MKYIHSHKFKALGIAVASAVAIAAAVPASATPQVTDTTGAITDTTGPKVTDTSGHSIGGNKKEPHYTPNPQQVAAVKALITQLQQAFQQGKTTGNYTTFNQLLPQAKAALLALGTQVKPPSSGTSITHPKPEPKPTDTTGGVTDTTGPKVTDTSGNSLDPKNKDEPKIYKDPAKVAALQALYVKLGQTPKGSAEYTRLFNELKLALIVLDASPTYTAANGGY